MQNVRVAVRRSVAAARAGGREAGLDSIQPPSRKDESCSAAVGFVGTKEGSNDEGVLSQQECAPKNDCLRIVGEDARYLCEVKVLQCDVKAPQPDHSEI